VKYLAIRPLHHGEYFFSEMPMNLLEDFTKADFEKPRPYVSRKLENIPDNWKVLEGFDWKTSKVIVEVGCGVGLYSLREAEAHLENTYIAIEKTEIRSVPLIREAKTHDLKNLIPLRADATLVIDQIFPEKSVDVFTFFYPNPWPKKRQANKRFMISPSFQAYQKALKPGGEVCLTSNVKAYVEETRDFLENFWGFEINSFEKIDSDFPARTAFEKKYLERGDACYEVRAVKKL
jgi:tRNA (guanine-N7-)-methyltransferase